MKPELKITTAIAASLLAAACSQQPDYVVSDRNTAVCVDRTGKRVSDQYCARNGGGGGGNAFLWYYLGRSSAVPYYGDPVTGGSYARATGQSYYSAPAAASMTRASAISRGGFGSTASGFGGAGE